jgi:hypothetical protein
LHEKSLRITATVGVGTFGSPASCNSMTWCSKNWENAAVDIDATDFWFHFYVSVNQEFVT